jgi:hypothetical protein
MQSHLYFYACPVREKDEQKFFRDIRPLMYEWLASGHRPHGMYRTATEHVFLLMIHGSHQSADGGAHPLSQTCRSSCSPSEAETRPAGGRGARELHSLCRRPIIASLVNL